MSSFFAKFNRPGSTPITQQKYIVKTVKIAATPKPAAKKPKPPNQASTPNGKPRVSLSSPPPSTSPKSALKRKRPGDGTKRSSPSSSGNSLKPPSPAPSRSRNAASSSRSPLSLRLESSSDSDSDDGERASKRSKMGSPAVVNGAAVERTRGLVNPLSFRSLADSSATASDGCFVHAENIANSRLEGYSTKLFKKVDQKLLDVVLQYPGIAQTERYQLVQHTDPDEFSPVADILTTIELVAQHLLTPPHAAEIFSETSGGIRYLLGRSLKRGEADRFLEELRKYNRLIRHHRKNGNFQKNISNMRTIPFALVEHILQQSYARTVALEVDALRNYEAWGNNVYGELLPKFTTKIFKDADLTNEKVFVDLGSGTGNVVLHAALEIGCESWGCEVMQKAAELAEKQKKEFVMRCAMWGIQPGKVRLEAGDFLENPHIGEVLRRADVLLVNNYAFSSDLNQRLINMFLDLKEGTKIISLKPFVPASHVVTTRNINDPVNRLRLEEKEYFSKSVSWTDAGGKYYVQTVDGSILRAFLER